MRAFLAVALADGVYKKYFKFKYCLLVLITRYNCSRPTCALSEGKGRVGCCEALTSIHTTGIASAVHPPHP